MAAPDILTLLQFEESVEPKIRDALITVGVQDDQVFIARSQEALITPSLSVLLQMGSTNGHRFAAPTNAFWCWDQWNVTVMGLIRTNRGTTREFHATHRAYMRLVMLKIFDTINPLLTYHAFAELPTENGTDNAVDDEHNHDISTIRFSSVLAIKRDAWPTS